MRSFAATHQVRFSALYGLAPHRVQLSNFPSPTTLRSILLINSVLCASAAFMSALVCFKVLVFEPKTTVPPITAAIAPIRIVGSNPSAPTTGQDQDSSSSNGDF